MKRMRLDLEGSLRVARPLSPLAPLPMRGETKGIFFPENKYVTGFGFDASTFQKT